MIRRTAALAILCLPFVFPVHAEDDAVAIVQKAFEAAKANDEVVRNYAFQERIEERRLNKKGMEKGRQSWTHDVTLLDGSEHRRLIARNDKPLEPKAEAKERRKLEKRLEHMRRETPEQRAKRLAKVEKGRKEGEKFLEEITKAFDFRLTGEDEIDGVAVYVITADPRAGYEPTSRETKVLTKVRGTLWIAKNDYAWVKAELKTLDDIRFAVAFKLRGGARVGFTQRRLNDEVWMMDKWYSRFRAKAALVFRVNREMTGAYSNFRRFETDSTVVHGEGAR